jgi:hypothetical protein
MIKDSIMSDDNWRDQLPQKVRVLQIIVGGMSLGCFMLLVVAILFSIIRKGEIEQSILTYISLAAAGTSFGVWLIAPGIMLAQGRKKICQTLLNAAPQQGDRSAGDKTEAEDKIALQLIPLFMTKIIVSCALLEGPIFFLLIVYILESGMLSFLTAIAMLILLVAQMPTVGRAVNWMENQIQLVEAELAFESIRNVN